MMVLLFNSNIGMSTAENVLKSTTASDSPSIASAYNNGGFQKTIRYYKALADEGKLEGFLILAVVLKDLGHYERAIEILKEAHHKFN